ncbi:hypothetical protein H8959_021140 [Pygathrix nigripes]
MFRQWRLCRPGSSREITRSKAASNREQIRSMKVENDYKLSSPEDVDGFWKFCEELDPEKPAGHFLQSLGLQLVGPSDILAGKQKTQENSTGPNVNLHWRFYYDPPEFQTITTGDNKTQYHMGYFRDSTDELPAYRTTKMKQRDKKVVTKVIRGAGLAVPVDKNHVGYTELPETHADIKRICKTIVEAAREEERLKAFVPIQEMMTFVQFANDERDYCSGLELGMELFCCGSHYFHKVAGQHLPLAYNLLQRNLQKLLRIISQTEVKRT